MHPCNAPRVLIYDSVKKKTESQEITTQNFFVFFCCVEPVTLLVSILTSKELRVLNAPLEVASATRTFVVSKAFKSVT